MAGNDLTAPFCLTKKEQCHVCQKAFHYKSDLRRHVLTHAKDGHDIRTCDDCMQQQCHIKQGRGKRARLPAAATVVRRDRSPGRFQDNDSESESSARAERNQSPHDSTTECSSSSGSNLSQAGEVGTAEAQPKRQTCSFNWNKRCHMCGQEFAFENKLRLHMLSHKREGHDMDRCEYCCVFFSWSKRTGCPSHDSLDSDNKQHWTEHRVEDQCDDDDGVTTHAADEEESDEDGESTAIGTNQKFTDQWTKICRQVKNDAASAVNEEAGINKDINAQQTRSEETALLVSGLKQELGKLSGIQHDAIQEPESSAAARSKKQTSAVNQGKEEPEVVDLSDETNCTSVKTGVTSEGVHFTSIRFFD